MYTTNPETQIEIEKMIALLSALSIGDIVTYETLSAAVGYDVQGRPFPMLKARKWAEKNSGMRFGTVRGVGIRKLSADAIAGIGADARKRVSRIARTQSRRLSDLAYNITGPARARVDAERSLLGAISSIASTPSATAIEREAATGPVVSTKVLSILAQRGAA